jgi:hypothetical protein
MRRMVSMAPAPHGGGRRALISLTLDEVSRLARGELRVVGQGASYSETFQALAAQMVHFGSLRARPATPSMPARTPGASALPATARPSGRS